MAFFPSGLIIKIFSNQYDMVTDQSEEVLAVTPVPERKSLSLPGLLTSVS